MKQIFCLFSSFFDTVESIYRVDILENDQEESIDIRPDILISPIIERHFSYSKESADGAAGFAETCAKLLKRFPSSQYTLTVYRTLHGLSRYLQCEDFAPLEHVCNPFAEPVRCTTVRELYTHYLTITAAYQAWQEENKDYHLHWTRHIPPMPPLTRHAVQLNATALFSESGILYQHGFTRREQQETLALAIEKACLGNTHLLANAPTGIGKSLAYLTNAAIVSSHPEHRVLVSTFSKRLQNQLREKDVPLTEKILGTALGIAFLKGRTNYICLNRVQMLFSSSHSPLHDYLYAALTAGIREIEALHLPDDDKDTLRAYTCDPHCAYKELCFYRTARERAMKAQICVLNHALLIRERSFGRFAHCTHVFIDEAHHIEELIVKELGGELSRDSFRFLDFAPYRPAQEFSRKWRMLFDDIDDADHETAELFFADAAHVRTLLTEQELREQFDTTLQIVRRYFYFGEHYYKEPVERHDGRFIKLYPYRIDGWMQQKFWNAFRSVCMLSGTLFVNDGAMRGIVLRSLGAPEPPQADSVSLPSPFDYPACTRFFVPADFPRYDYQEKHIYIDAVAVFLREFIVRTEAKTLVLFTAYEDMLQTAELLSDFFKEQSIQLFMNVYREEEVEKAIFPVIFGTYGMWEGVDIKGNLLQSVIMVKSPFSSPNDGFFKTKQHTMNDSLFYLYYLNSAVMKFRQGFGRLIRSVDDKGVFVLLDNRITAKSYKKFFISSIAQNLQLSFIPTRDIFNHAESFLFDKTGAFLKDYRTNNDTYRFLDYKQLYIARDGERGIKIIYGGAGTGKTVVLIHRLKYLLMHFSHVERILFVTFNAALARFIENIMSVESILPSDKTIHVRYFYELCAGIIPKPDTSQPFDAYYRMVKKALDAEPTLLTPYDAVFVDEGQDFGPLEYEIITRFLNPSSADFMCAIDKNQAIYDIDFSRFFTDKPIRYYTVERSYRNTAAIQAVAARFNRSLFVHDDDYYFNHGSSIRVIKNDNLSALLENTATFIETMIAQGYSAGDCAVLYPTHALYGFNDFAESFGELLRARGIRVTTLTLPKKKKTFTLRDNTVKLSTIHAAKGLEFPVVVFIGSDTIPANNKGNNLCYVAITRARQELCCVYAKPVQCAEILDSSQNVNTTNMMASEP